MKAYRPLIILCLLGFAPLHAQTNLDRVIGPSSLPHLKPSKLIQISSFDSTGANNDRINIHTGKTATIMDVKGPGVITRIWITIDSRDPHFLRRILLRMYWDGEVNPSVEVPVGDFFGTGFEYRHYASPYLGMTSGGYVCYFPMPFNKSARIEVVNETGQEVYAFYYHINYHKLEKKLAKDVAYFHAQWRRDPRTSSDENYVVLEAEGTGHLVGMNMSAQPYNKSMVYLEGDEMIYVDGEKFPSIYGTGTEDYFSSGWYFRTGEYAAPYHGLLLKDDATGRIAAYRYHINDAIPFKKSLLFTLEHGHANEQTIDMSTTAYWYQKEPHRKFPVILKSSMRIPLRHVVPNGMVEAESLQPTGSGFKASVVDMSDHGPEWSGHSQLLIEPEKAGKSAEIVIDNAIERAYDVHLYYTTGQEYGNVDIYHGNKKVGSFSGYSEQVLPGNRVVLENIATRDGTLPLKIAITGKEADASGYAAGLDGFLLVPKREYVPEWYMIGPFPNPRESDILRYGLDNVYPPEKEFNLAETYEGAEGQTVKWKLYKIGDNGFMSLWDKVKPYEFVVVYALTYVYSPDDREATLLIGTDDGAKVFLNGEELYRFLDVRIAGPDQDEVTLPLKAGWNQLLLKIENNFGGYGFFARVRDTSRSLKISVNKK